MLLVHPSQSTQQSHMHEGHTSSSTLIHRLVRRARPRHVQYHNLCTSFKGEMGMLGKTGEARRMYRCTHLTTRPWHINQQYNSSHNVVSHECCDQAACLAAIKRLNNNQWTRRVSHHNRLGSWRASLGILTSNSIKSVIAIINFIQHILKELTSVNNFNL
jgi:hypothetical protein